MTGRIPRPLANAPDGPTEAQDGGWSAILHGRRTLICTPTGSGKTLAVYG